MIDKDTILKTLGYDALTPMQEAMLQVGANPGGVVLLSPTGTGKTLGYLLPAVRQIDLKLDVLQVVVVEPTRELAVQCEMALKSMKTGARSLSLYGGRPTMEEHRKLREVQPHIVFATPGRLNDHLGKGNVHVSGVKVLIIDEFDKCLELGFQAEMEDLLKHFSKVRCCWLMSATDADEIPTFMQRLFQTFKKLDYLSEGDASTENRLQLRLVRSPQKDKLETLSRLLTTLNGAPTIVFVAYRESVERVGKWLREQGFSAEIYHGGMEQDWRERALYKFRSGAANVLVSTDLAARGLDIPEVRAIVHYHLPLKEEDYMHRNGRTARWDADGMVYWLLGPTEQLPAYAHDVCEFELDTHMRIIPVLPRYATIYIGRGKRDKLSKGDVLGFLCKKGGLRSDEIGRIDVGAHYAYASVLRQRLKAVLKLVAGEKIKGMKTLIEEMKR